MNQKQHSICTGYRRINEGECKNPAGQVHPYYCKACYSLAIKDIQLAKLREEKSELERKINESKTN